MATILSISGIVWGRDVPYRVVWRLEAQFAYEREGCVSDFAHRKACGCGLSRLLEKNDRVGRYNVGPAFARSFSRIRNP